MPAYNGVQKEETLKGLVYKDYFSKYGYEPNIGNIDFVITDNKTRTASDLFTDNPPLATRHFLWAEAKKGVHDVFDMFTQLILTCKKTYDAGEHLAPPWLGVFDEARIAFVSFHGILPIFNETDFNWNTTPSNHETADFQKAREKVAKLIAAKIAVYNFGGDDTEIKEFIKTHFVAGASASIKSPITKDNFVQIFIKWVKEVKPFIDVTKEEWADYKKAGILDGDFYRADIMSAGGNTITEKLKIVLKNDNYKLQDKNTFGKLSFADIGFTDGGTAYGRFWNRYERPPAAEYRQYITDRRDLLVPANIREVKGSFFTPKIWADKSKEYLAKAFGGNWQDEYYVWDCAAGTGNLLAGLTNKYNLWASDIDAGNVETMQSLMDIDENLNLLNGHVFQFDFLNDSFDKLPEELKKIIGDPEKRQKLIVYINPPYAEAANHGARKNKAQVTVAHKTSETYKDLLGRGINELFANFFIKIYHLLPDAKLASFSTLKYINSQNFIKFREYFKAEYKAGFICQADTFDNVKGKFPIGFLIWDLSNKKEIVKVKTDVLMNNDGLTKCRKDGEKYFYANSKKSFIIDWLRTFFDQHSECIGYMRIQGVDFQQNHTIFITSRPSDADIRESKIANITKNNLTAMCIYLTVRHCIEATWLNDRDQFLFPKDGYKTDTEFQNNCLVFCLFHGQNKISSLHGVNHWIPFTEKEVGAGEKFESNFMSDFLRERGLTAEFRRVKSAENAENILNPPRTSAETSASSAVNLSPEALAVLDAGRELWRYYHAKPAANHSPLNPQLVNASFYDIREHFQGRKESGAMNTTSTDETYTVLLAALRNALKTLTVKIQPQVYEYGFLKG